jgi:hypothetical protein
MKLYATTVKYFFHYGRADMGIRAGCRVRRNDARMASLKDLFARPDWLGGRSGEPRQADPESAPALFHYVRSLMLFGYL